MRIEKPEVCKLRCMARIWNKEGKFLLFDGDKGNHDDAARLVIVINNIFKENLVSAFCCGACFVDCVVMTLKAKKDLRRFGNVCPYKKAEDKKDQNIRNRNLTTLSSMPSLFLRV